VEVLRSAGREDLSLARLVEPHLDAVAIGSELDRPVREGCWYAVWASAPRPTLRRRDDGTSVLVGEQAFCSGATLCDAALVAADDGDDVVLVDVDLRRGRAAGTTSVDLSAWSTPAFGATGTGSVTYRDHPVDVADRVGAPGAYLDRPGFWHGALGPAAVWAGGADGLVEAAEDRGARDAHERALLGELRSLRWAMVAELAVAADEGDAAPLDGGAARRRAAIVRNLVERQCTRVIDLFGRLGGPRALAHDGAASARVQELSLYIRQVHRAQELEQLGGTPW
jgi:alkylation response protein AidB-like acyl-CoA dehydrogenase